MTGSLAYSKRSARTRLRRAQEREELLCLAEGIPDLIKLGRGDPDLETPPHIVDAGIAALRDGFTHYTHWAGIQDLRDAIGDRLRRDNGLEYDPQTEIVVTSGVQEGIYLACQSILEPGDEVLIGDPFYTSYEVAVSMAGGTLIRVPTTEMEGFILQPEALSEAITPRTKALVIVTPNNPTGSVIPSDTLARIARIAEESDLIVFSDEIYEKLVFDGAVHTSIASMPGMKTRSIVLNGFSKTYAMTGWRVGYIAAPADFVQACGAAKHALTISPNHAAQRGALMAIRGGDSCVRKMVEVYHGRRQVAFARLREMDLTYAHPEGTYYIFVNITSTGRSSYEFCRDILRDAHVQLFPGTVFGDGEGYVRVSLLAPEDILAVAMDRIANAIAS